MRRILITGGTVFVSMYTARFFLNLGDEVYVLNRNSKKQLKGVNLIECDRDNINDELKGIHFNAVIDINAYNRNQIEKLIDSLDSFDDYIMISSSAVYPELNAQPFSENQQCGYNSIWKDYGTNKLAAENILFQKVKNAYVLRPPYLYGELQNLYRECFVFDCADQNRAFYVPCDGDMKLQFFYVGDLCAIIQKILDIHPVEHILNVGNYKSVTIKEWVSICYKAAGKEPPKFVSVHNVDNLREYFCFNNYEYMLDVTLQKKYFPRTTALLDGLKASYIWYKTNKNNPDYSDYFQKKKYFKFIEEQL